METIKAELGQLENWTEKETTQAQIQTFIYSYLWDDNTGLPVDAYLPGEIETLSRELFRHVYQQYPSATENAYSMAM